MGVGLFGFEYAPAYQRYNWYNKHDIAGPILGTIPCALILLLVNPIGAVWFVVFIIIIGGLILT